MSVEFEIPHARQIKPNCKWPHPLFQLQLASEMSEVLLSNIEIITNCLLHFLSLRIYKSPTANSTIHFFTHAI